MTDRAGIMRGLSMAMTLQNVSKGTVRGKGIPPCVFNGNVFSDGSGCIAGFTSTTSRLMPLKQDPTSANDYPEFLFSHSYLIQAKVFLSADMARDQVLWGSQVNPFYAVPSVEVQGSSPGDDHAIWAGHASISGGWPNQLRIAREDFDPVGQWSYIRQSYKNGTFTLAASHDAIRWVRSTVGNVNPFYKDSTGEFGLGNLALGNTSANNVKFDMQETFVVVDDALVWGAGYRGT